MPLFKGSGSSGRNKVCCFPYLITATWLEGSGSFHELVGKLENSRETNQQDLHIGGAIMMRTWEMRKI